MAKLLSHLPSAKARALRALCRRVIVGQPASAKIRAGAGVIPEQLLGLFEQAFSTGIGLGFHYTDREGKKTVRRGEPHGLLAEPPVWYVGTRERARTRVTSVGTTHSHVAMNRSAALDRTFHALTDSTRRSMIHALSGGKMRSAGELGAEFRSAQPTISRHLKVLESARLIERSVEGRVHRFRLRREALEEAGTWIRRHQAFWAGAVDQLEQLLKETDR